MIEFVLSRECRLATVFKSTYNTWGILRAPHSSNASSEIHHLSPGR
jgi:hypothetical protein